MPYVMQDIDALTEFGHAYGMAFQVVDDILDVFNDAWQHNWGFVPATETEAKKMAADLKLILNDLSFFAEIDGQPVAICVCPPNLNEVVRDFGGKLTPVTVGKLLWLLKVREPKSARLMLLGIRTELRGKKRYAPLALAMIGELIRRGLRLGYEWAELGWTLEDNRLINAAIKSVGGYVYKRYAVALFNAASNQEITEQVAVPCSVLSATMPLRAAESLSMVVSNSSPSRTLMIAMPWSPMVPLTMTTSPGRTSAPAVTFAWNDQRSAPSAAVASQRTPPPPPPASR